MGLDLRRLQFCAGRDSYGFCPRQPLSPLLSPPSSPLPLLVLILSLISSSSCSLCKTLIRENAPSKSSIGNLSTKLFFGLFLWESVSERYSPVEFPTFVTFPNGTGTLSLRLYSATSKLRLRKLVRLPAYHSSSEWQKKLLWKSRRNELWVKIAQRVSYFYLTGGPS